MRTLSILIALCLTFLRPAAADEATGSAIAEAAITQTRVTTIYDPAYVVIPYPNGDVPAERGVCSDVVIRALRAVGVDLQKLVHEDMKANFRAYPRNWGLRRPDRNIDHRRVPNLETFLTRKGARLSPARAIADYKPGDLVSWDLKGDKGYLPHIGVVTARKTRSGRPLIVHNIGAGARIEDVLLRWEMTGHFRPAGVITPPQPAR
jgi:hypothetical protein